MIHWHDPLRPLFWALCLIGDGARWALAPHVLDVDRRALPEARRQ